MSVFAIMSRFPRLLFLLQAKAPRLSSRAILRRFDCIVLRMRPIAKGNNEAVADFRRLVNSTVSSVSASALNLVNLNQENLPDDSNVLFADLIPSLSTSG